MEGLGAGDAFFELEILLVPSFFPETAREIGADPGAGTGRMARGKSDADADDDDNEEDSEADFFLDCLGLLLKQTIEGDRGEEDDFLDLLPAALALDFAFAGCFEPEESLSAPLSRPLSELRRRSSFLRSAWVNLRRMAD